MSIEIGIHVSFAEGSDHSLSRIMGEALSVAANLYDFSVADPNFPDEASVFNGVRFLNALDSTKRMFPIATCDPAEVIALITAYDDDLYEVSVDAAYTYLGFEDSDWSLISKIRPLEIACYRKERGPDGDGYRTFRNKMYGELVITFWSVKTFQPPSRLIDLLEDPDISHERHEELCVRLRQFGDSFNAVHNFAREIVRRLDPEHLIVCPNLEVHPFMAYGLYHKRFQDFCADLHKAMSLHTRGGLYLTEVDETFPFFIEPRRQSKDYGFLRDKYGDDTGDRLTSLMDAIATKLKDAPPKCASIDEIAAVFSAAEMTAEILRDSLYVSDEDAPFMYITEAFLEMAEHLYKIEIPPIWTKGYAD